MPHSDDVEIRRSDIVPLRGFCAAREGNYVGETAAKGLQVEVREERCEVEGDDYCGFPIRVWGAPEGPIRGQRAAFVGASRGLRRGGRKALIEAGTSAER
ncbi:MAG: hypothetical protein V3U45_05805 [bacterium]